MIQFGAVEMVRNSIATIVPGSKRVTTRVKKVSTSAMGEQTVAEDGSVMVH